MFTQLRVSTWIVAVLTVAFVASIETPLVLGQGDEGSVRNNSTGENKVFGGAIQRFFGSRDKAPDANENRPTAPRTSDRSLKPGALQGGIVKQLRSTTNESADSQVRVQQSKTASGDEFAAPIPTSPSQMAQRTPTEPFRSSVNNAQSNSNANQTRQSPVNHDVFADDPPSIVGTGVDRRRLSTTSTDTRASVPYDPLPPISRVQPSSTPKLLAPAANAYKNTSKPNTEEELPRISRKTLPSVEPSRNGATVENSYAIPRNQYASPSGTSANESTSTRNNTKPTIQPIPRSIPYTPEAMSLNSNQKIDSTAKPNSTNAAAKTPAAPVTPIAKPTASGTETRLEMGVPKVKLFVSGPPSMQVGRAIPYEVLVRNEGTEVLGGVIVSMTIPATVKSSLPVATSGEFESEKDAAGIESLLWHVADLAPSQSRVFRVSLEAFKAEHFAMDVEWTVLPQTGQVKIDVQQPQLNLSLEGPSEVIWGKPEVYRMRVRNPGNAEVKDVDVRLTAEAYGSNQTKLGDIPAGSERIVEVELTFQQTGSINIAGEAHSAVSSLESKSSIDVAVTQVNLAAEWNSPPEQYQGSVAGYSLKISNNSPVPAENATCVAIVPSGLRVISMPEGAAQTGNEIRWSVPKIAPNSSQIFDFTFQANEAGSTKLLSNIQSLGGGKASVEAIVKIESVSDLKLSVTDPVAPAPVGQDVIYDLIIVNRGSKTAQGVKLLAQFSNGIEPVRTEGGTARVLPGQVVFDPIVSIEPGQEITLRVIAQATEAGMHRFRAELESEDGETQLIEEETTRFLATSRTESNKATIRR